MNKLCDREYGKQREYKIIVRVTEQEKKMIDDIRSRGSMNLSSLFRNYIRDFHMKYFKEK